MILLATINATYQHASFGLRYLFANLGDLQKSTTMLEFVSTQKATDLAEKVLTLNPKILGLGVYIWNTRQTLELVGILKKVRPELKIILGGPEVSYEYQNQPLSALADHVVLGEGENLFPELCRKLIRGLPVTDKFISGPLPDVKAMASPYPYYTDEDIKNRFIYVEASRGCPYKCEFCLSSLDTSVRTFDLDQFFTQIDQLLVRGARHFKFVDRTFNLNITTTSRILNFFLERIDQGLFLHFELVPDRFPEELKSLVMKFPEGSLQFEIGIQTWNTEVSKLISRRQDYSKVEENLTFLARKTKVHVHADLIAGLPGETLESFADGFDRLYALSPSEIQVGILKRLKGTPIIRHDKEWAMLYDETPPFQILSNKTMDFSCLQAISRFAKFWDLYANSGNFSQTMKLLYDLSAKRGSFFWQFWEFAEFLNRRHPQRYAIALVNLVESAWEYLKPRMDQGLAREALIQDYTGFVRRDIPPFLREEAPVGLSAQGPKRALTPGTQRQSRHQRTF